MMDTVSLVTIPETGVTLHIDPTKEGSLPDANMDGSSRKKPKRRKKKKKEEEALCVEEKTLDVVEKTTEEDQLHPPKNPLSNIRIQEDSSHQGQDSCEKPEDSQSGAVDMSSSERKKKRRKKKKSNDINALRESGVDTSSLVTMECDARHSSEAQGSKLKTTKEKNGDGTVDKQKGADAEADDTVSETQNPKVKKKKRRKTKTTEVREAVEDTLATSMESGPVECMETASVCEVKSKTRKRKKKKTSLSDQETADMEVCDPSENTLATSMESRPVECMGTASVCEVKSKKRKRKKKKTSLSDQETADMEVCDPSENTLPGTIESASVECLLDHSNKEVLENCDKNAGQELVAEKETKDEIGEPKQKRKKKKKKESCELSEEVSEPKQKKKKKKKKKSCEDDKTDNMDVEKKDDVSVPRSERELESDGIKLGTSLSSSVLIPDNGVASQETGDVPRCSCKGQSTRKLVVFDLNGILADIARGNTGKCVPDGKISLRSVFKRPFVATFLDFCFEKFDVGIWSSRRIGLNYMTNIVMGRHAKNLLFSFDQRICITTKFKTLGNTTKPLFLKNLRTVWNRFGTCLSCGKRKYDETNTLLVDDSPDKALCNPPHTGIFPFPYQYTDREDSALGPDGELMKYMERLVDAENVQKFVEKNPMGQSAITETHESWSFYSRVIKAHKS
ncbi:hypothetical protein IGI04_032294 [Brassica rapa subsp. trilocularis]|uniref:FCP1 homology domain-containing protein n=1 Tax=Brassica rapa subsp. trilocularis TaxID=1813537 RepID=A0ABQ7LW07_BRACM|nr:hypothetical protein IGI04_032294 [Brassica rapa subsp. trilocularis]